MSGTNAAAIKSKLVGTGNVLSGLTGMADSGVIVAYDMPRDIPREVVFGGDIAGPVELEAFRQDSSSRVTRDEQLTFQLYVQVRSLGQSTTEVSDTRACAISTLIENYIALNSTLGGLTGLLVARVQDVRLTGSLDDEGATSQVILTIGCQTVET